jgi:hypothetical protein
LPGGIEPYRIWFEWLKLAMQDPRALVDRDHYEQWGDLGNQTFEKWFEANWRRLFGVYVVKKLKRGDKVKDPKKFITIEFSKRGMRSKVADQIMCFLDEMEYEEAYPEASFMLTETYNTGLLSNISEARRNLRLYEIALQFPNLDERSLIEEIASKYVASHEDWARFEKSQRRAVAKTPAHYLGLSEFVRQRSSNRSLSIHDWNFDSGREFLSGEECRRFVIRHWKMVKKQTEGICRGEFPLQGKPRRPRIKPEKVDY